MNHDEEAAPDANPHPTHSVSLAVAGFGTQNVRFDARYATTSDVRSCKHFVHNGGKGYDSLNPLPYLKDVPIILTPTNGGIANGTFATDKFLPGQCAWQFRGLTYTALDAPEVESRMLTLFRDRFEQGGDPDAQMPLNLWCYQVTYEQKPQRDCLPLIMLRQPNAPGEVSSEFLSTHSPTQPFDRGIRQMTPETTEVNVALNSLNAIPGALISDGERAAQIAQAEAREAAREQTPEYKAVMCYDQLRAEYSNAHRPLPDNKTANAALAVFQKECEAKFGVKLSDYKGFVPPY